MKVEECVAMVEQKRGQESDKMLEAVRKLIHLIPVYLIYGVLMVQTILVASSNNFVTLDTL